MLTEEERKIGRRAFLQAAATLPVLGAFGWAAYSKAAHDRPVQAGIIGAGAEGRVLLENAPAKLIEFRAVADIRPDSREAARAVISTRWGKEPEMFPGDYRKLLERDDLEAVVIATPLWMHAPMTLAALNAGKHVFCEKTMALKVADAKRMWQAARSQHRVLQIGHQRHANKLYHWALGMIKQGRIGDVYHVRTLWHRNSDWRRELPSPEELKAMDPSFSAEKWGYGSLEELVNWRLYRKYSDGLMGELGSHQIDVVNWFAGTVPKRVLTSGGVYAYDDGRNVADHIFATYEYPGGDLCPTGLTATFSAITTNKLDNYYEQFMGTKGTIIISGEGEGMLFSESDDQATSIALDKATSGKPLLAASASRLADASSGQAAATAAGPGRQIDRLEPYAKELEAFCSAIKYGTDVPCSPQAALAAAVAVSGANEAADKKQAVELPASLYQI